MRQLVEERTVRIEEMTLSCARGGGAYPQVSQVCDRSSFWPGLAREWFFPSPESSERSSSSLESNCKKKGGQGGTAEH